MGGKVITIPAGSYEIENIENYLQKILSTREISISLQPNNNTLCSEIKCPINFGPEDSIGHLLGFTLRILAANVTHRSDLLVTIPKVNSLRVECNITTDAYGMYINGQRVHTIHEFSHAVPPGYKIVKVPSHIIYLPITVQAIDYIQSKLVDQDGQCVNLRGEVVTIRLHIKS